MIDTSEFVERRMVIYKCESCEHPAMLIEKKEKLSDNSDGSEQDRITLKCPRCKHESKVIINHDKGGEVYDEDNSKVVPVDIKVV